MYSFNTFAYTHLQFLPPNSLFSLACTVNRLAEVLACTPHYAQAVRTLRIVGWCTVNIPDGYNREKVYNALDGGVNSILKNAPHIHSLTLDFNLSREIHFFPQTFAALAQVRTVRHLRLTPFLVPMCKPEDDNNWQERTPEQAPRAYERISVRMCGGPHLPVIIQDPRNLRWLGFTLLEKIGSRGDQNWALTIQRVAEAATELETLVLENWERFDSNTLGPMLQSSFVRVASEVVYPVLVADHNGINNQLL